MGITKNKRMRLYLEIFEGPNKGDKFGLTERTSFGRKGADILLRDPKLSGVHVFFDFTPETGWFLVDNQSRNGVWVNGMKEVRVIIKNADEVQMGDTRMSCRLLDTNALLFSDSFQLWMETLYQDLENGTNPLKQINPEIRLKVIQGIQYGEFWDIFYGPRKAGRDSSDICLRDESAPRETFEIRLKGKYAYFYTENENVVMINGRSVKEKQFTPGDVISFGDTRIKVEIDQGHGFSD